MTSTCHPICTQIASEWDLVGKPTLVGLGSFVQLSGKRGYRWLLLSYWPDGHWSVVSHKTKEEAIDGRKLRLRFRFGGPNVWGES
jgi:hypothetical protein